MDKETLQKKIESGDTVWLARSKKPEKLKLYKDCFTVDENKLYECDKNHTILLFACKLDKIFATKEEAEWVAEFGNITRTEKLELPSWEQALEQSLEVGIGTTFVDAHKGKWQLIFAKDEIILCDWSLMSRDKRWKKLTHENYLEACRICKKLFLGEEL